MRMAVILGAVCVAGLPAAALDKVLRTNGESVSGTITKDNVKGIEMTEYDLDALYKQKEVFFSFGDDFDYNVRVKALKFLKHLG